ncbi:MAG: MerR family transcriptional regulator [Firmicutes bacterium]|nr:MerR family transcriptional regulator [Bacillota bacterium]
MRKIKDVVELSGLSRRTLQYYDDTGLLNNSRTPENYRHYGDEDLERLWRIILYKEMGFQLDEIRKLLNQDECDTRDLLMKRLDSIKKEISELQRILNFIEKVIDYGLPDMNADDLGSDGMTMAEMAGIFSERL